MWDLVLLRRIVVCKRTVVGFVTYIYIIIDLFSKKQRAECIRTPPRNSLTFSTAHRTRSHSLELRNLRSFALSYVVQCVHLLKLWAKIDKKMQNAKCKMQNVGFRMQNAKGRVRHCESF